MKTILMKCKINPTTYFFFLAFFITGHIKNIILISTIVFIHEMGHVFFLKRKQIPIESIEFFPFGGITKTNRPINTPINEDLLIYFGGILFQILLFGIFLLFKNGDWINENTFLLFQKYNNSIFLFNCLPICPLDGGEIVKLFLEKKYSYQKAYNISLYFSFIGLFLFFLINIQFNLSNYIVIVFLLLKGIEQIKKRKFCINKFYLERYMYTFPFKKIENHPNQNVTVLKKETKHYFKEANHYIDEKKVLARRFDRNRYFW